MYRIAILISIVCLIEACDSPSWSPDSNELGHTAPTLATQNANQAFIEKRPFANTQDFDNARKGLIAQPESLVVPHRQGGTVWNMPEYNFIDANGENAPASVNPSLWRQAALNNIHGLFKVSEAYTNCVALILLT